MCLKHHFVFTEENLVTISVKFLGISDVTYLCQNALALNLAVKSVLLYKISKANGSKTHSQITEH
jgi:hypothetical protein